MTAILRIDGGRFAKGTKGGPGRPPRATEAKYLAAMASCVSLDDWQEIVTAAVTSAKEGDSKARQWLASYLLPKPEHANLDDAIEQTTEADARATGLAALAESFGTDGLASEDPGPTPSED